jgi:tRNA (mo5U34)-methyltransferase
MGVLYHTRSPIEHLGQLKDCIAVDGELVLETIVVEGGETKLLTPKNSYAGMKNIWFIPSLKLLKLWLEKVGFYDIKILDSTRTTTDEQRKTPWSPYRSLEEGLDKNNPNITIEGLEWGERVTIFAKKRF